MIVPEGSVEADYLGRRVVWGRIECNPRWVREWFLSAVVGNRRHLWVAGWARGRGPYFRQTSWEAA